jgi:CheY-like chemotaxis protein
MVAVKDTGIGISKEGQARLFERFNQATPKTKEIYGGSGLGLNISRKLCHLHGGEVGVASKEGYGSTFGFFFKVKRAEEEPASSERTREDNSEADGLKDHIEELGNASPDELDPKQVPQSVEIPPGKEVEEANPRPTGCRDNRYRETSDVAAHVQESESDRGADSERPRRPKEHQDQVYARFDDSPAPSYPKQAKSSKQADAPTVSGAGKDGRMHVLLVEDNIINQRIVHRKLEAKGYNVTTANNGKEAVDALRNAAKPSSDETKGAFDVVLMDQEMPVMDGNAAAREIRELEGKGEVERTPILGVTANVRKAQQDEMIESGMDDVISKPYKIDEMVGKIEKITGHGG